MTDSQQEEVKPISEEFPSTSHLEVLILPDHKKGIRYKGKPILTHQEKSKKSGKQKVKRQ